MLTANDRLKRRWTTWYSRGIVVAVVVHFAVLVLWPTMTSADLRIERAETALIQPPQVDIPPAPEALARPAMPVVSKAQIDESITIPSVDERVWRAEALQPPAASRPAETEEYRVFAPSMVAPRVLKPAAVERALERQYPPLLRDAGVGGRVHVNLWLDEQGKVTRAEVSRSSGYPQLDAAALRVIDVMRFSPALNMNAPTRVIVELPVIFQVR